MSGESTHRLSAQQAHAARPQLVHERVAVVAQLQRMLILGVPMPNVDAAPASDHALCSPSQSSSSIHEVEHCLTILVATPCTISWRDMKCSYSWLSHAIRVQINRELSVRFVLRSWDPSTPRPSRPLRRCLVQVLMPASCSASMAAQILLFAWLFVELA